jgi:hypothetical protein
MGGKIEERIEVTKRGGRRDKQLLDDFKETRASRNLKEKTLYFSLWRIRKRLWTSYKTDYEVDE